MTLREVGDAFAHAKANAAELGAGTLVFVGRFDLAEFAVVLEPDEPLRTARRAFYAGMAALGDALLAHAPPEKPIAFVWPDAIHVDGGLVGGGAARLAATAPEDEPPDWLVFGGMIRTVSMGEGEPGAAPAVDRARGRRLRRRRRRPAGRKLCAPSDGADRRLAGVRLQRVAKTYLPRLAPEKAHAPRHRRQRRSAGAAARTSPTSSGSSLTAALAKPSWLDPEDAGAAAA